MTLHSCSATRPLAALLLAGGVLLASCGDDTTGDPFVDTIELLTVLPDSAPVGSERLVEVRLLAYGEPVPQGMVSFGTPSDVATNVAHDNGQSGIIWPLDSIPGPQTMWIGTPGADTLFLVIQAQAVPAGVDGPAVTQ